MEFKKIFRSLSGKKKANGVTEKSAQQLPMVSQSSTYFQSIAKLPLHKYIDCAVNSNYATLTLSGMPTYQELALAWLEIQQEYADAIGDFEHKMYLSLVKEVTELSATLTQVKVCAKVLRAAFIKQNEPGVNEYIEYFKAELNILTGADCDFDLSDKDDFEKDVRMCESRSKATLIAFELANISLKAMKKKNTGEKPSYAYFDGMLIALSDTAGYHLTDNIMTMEFVNRIKRANSKK